MQRDNPQYSESAIPAESVTAPDFDNETTLRSARRVVPLAKTNHNSDFLLWLCGAAAFLLIGVAIGVLIQFGRRSTSLTADSTPKVTAEDAGINANSPVENTSDLADYSEPDLNPENSASVDVEPEVNRENSASGNVDSGMPSAKRKDSARLNDDSGGRGLQNLDNAPDTRVPSNLNPVTKRSRRVTEQTSATSRTNPPDEIFQPSELGTEEQRSRRVIERTPTINRSHARDGIFRIEDIFRGSRRP